MADARAIAPLRILVIFETLPFAEGGGADYRMLQILRLLREEGHSVTLLAPRTGAAHLQAPGSHVSALNDLSIEMRLEDAEVLRLEGIDISGGWTFADVLREGQFDVAMVSLWFWMGVTLPEYYLDQIRRFSPGTRVAVLTDDYHGLRERCGAEISGLWSDRERAIDFNDRELDIYRLADLVIAISDSDRQRIAQEIGPIPIEVLPVMIEAQPENKDHVILRDPKGTEGPLLLPAAVALSHSLPGFDEREGVVYLGHFNNSATLDGLEWYIREVAPLVHQKLPGLKLYVVGPHLPQSWSTPDPSVVRVGFQADLAAEFAKYRILVSPVRFGTGIKSKNLHALANGLPIVTNTKGAEGANLVSGETALIAEDPKAFAEAVIQLYSDRALWQKLSENSQAHAGKHFSKEAMRSALRAILNRMGALRPQAYDPSHVWSMRLVEKMYPEITTYQPAQERSSLRILAYSRAAEELLATGNRAEARRQVRHVFNYFSHAASRRIFFGAFAAATESIERTYRALGEAESAKEFRREAGLFSGGGYDEGFIPPVRSAELHSVPGAPIRNGTALPRARSGSENPAG